MLDEFYSQYYVAPARLYNSTTFIDTGLQPVLVYVGLSALCKNDNIKLRLWKIIYFLTSSNTGASRVEIDLC